MNARQDGPKQKAKLLALPRVASSDGAILQNNTPRYDDNSLAVRILLADDFTHSRSIVREIVDHTSAIIGEACDGVEAVERPLN
jgi:hypothetical protein